MKIIETKILSCSDADNTFPWAEFTFDPKTLEVTITNFNGLNDKDQHKRIADKKKHKLSLTNNNEPHALYITLDGLVKFTPFKEQPPIVYAHLAFYYPKTNESEERLEVLKFIPMHTANADV